MLKYLTALVLNEKQKQPMVPNDREKAVREFWLKVIKSIFHCHRKTVAELPIFYRGIAMADDLFYCVPTTHCTMHHILIILSPFVLAWMI